MFQSCFGVIIQVGVGGDVVDVLDGDVFDVSSGGGVDVSDGGVDGILVAAGGVVIVTVFVAVVDTVIVNVAATVVVVAVAVDTKVVFLPISMFVAESVSSQCLEMDIVIEPSNSKLHRDMVIFLSLCFQFLAFVSK